MRGKSPKSNKVESPKTPGGISKSLLTPCRRVGLSRKWKKGGCSPFVSPLSTQNSTAEQIEEKVTQKGNKQISETPKEQRLDVDETIVSTPKSCSDLKKTSDITTTPCRSGQISRKKSKTLSLSLKNSEENKEEILSTNKCHSNENEAFKEKISSANNSKEVNDDHLADNVLKPVKQLSKECISKLAKSDSKGKCILSLKRSLSKGEGNTQRKLSKQMSSEDPKPKEKSPNNLTKECIVVIQNKIFNTESHMTKTNEILKVSQGSDTEDTPLSVLKKDSIESVTLNTLHDDDFIGKPPKELQRKKSRNLSTIKPSKTSQSNIESNRESQSSQEDKRTILIRKSYDKVKKSSKAKSTGSITQKDIDDLTARIEMKKKLLMAKAMSIDTEELRGLIKKWQKGCQDALMELLHLMKRKLPDRQNMDYAEILQTLNIPAELVGYDSENDCFVTPEDTNVLLSTFKL